MMPVKIRIRRGTSGEWAASGAILDEGELGLDIDTGVVKVGDGATIWSSLPALNSGGGGAVDSVNGQTGAVVLDAADVGAATAAQGVLASTASQPGHTHTVAAISDFTTAVDARVQNIVGAAPAALDTLVEISAALGNDANYAATMTTALAGKVPTSRTVNGKPLTANVTLTNTDVGAAATTHNHPATDINDSTTVGRAVVTAASAAAARTTLGVSATGTQTINAQTGTSYTLQATDVGGLVTLSNTGAITLNAPGSVFTAGQRVDVLVINTGMATVVGTAGATANGTPSLVSRARYSAFTVVWLTSTSCVVVGDLA